MELVFLFIHIVLIVITHYVIININISFAEVIQIARVKEPNLKFGNTMKKLRGDKQQKIVAEELGISSQSLVFYEKGEREPNYDMLIKIAEYYNVTTDYLIGRTSYETDRDKQFEQLVLTYRKSVENQPVIIRGCFNNCFNGIFGILSEMLENEQRTTKIMNFSAIISKLHNLIRRAILTQYRMSKSVADYLTDIKYLHFEAMDMMKEIIGLIEDLSLPFRNIEFDDPDHELDKLPY